ncbi:lantibiotic dehydratase [Streptomyces sp. APSN-46.1]|uniref:lantibiotic dehydratase n=1 Tax=Streptomyces sp. APSN-46.1 TaxID=2929049 RepID=UPI001FB2469B|nr:lantibiotic dehydratase [Streptomyces sp. APSN-46.1]MCJ1679087.1 lantibiotic dehydratase [Streptomyces sp. APSN-46.1]
MAAPASHPGGDTPDTSTFRCADTLLFRAAPRAPEPPGARDEPGEPGEPGDQESDLRAHLRTAASDARLREAVSLASPSLSRTLDAVLAGEPVRIKQLRRAVRALARYRLRMSGRVTPFGTMAGVAAIGFAEAPKVVWGERHRKAARPDMGWLTEVVARLEREPAVLRRLRVTANDLCFRRGGRLVVPYVPAPGAGVRPAAQEVSVRAGEVVLRVVERAAPPVRFADLLTELVAAYPGVAAATVERLLIDLIGSEVLLTELRPPLDGPDPLGHVLVLLAPRPTARPTAEPLPAPVAEVVTELASIHRELATYAAAPLGSGLAARDAAIRRMAALHPSDHLLQVDLGLDVDVRLPPAVRAEVERAAEALWRLAAARPGPAHLRQYHEDFLERYGAGRAVPLKEVLDPDTGLGGPAGYRLPATARTLRATPADPKGPGPKDQDRLLTELAQEASVNGEREIVLDDALLERLAADGGEAPPPPSFEILAQLLADTPEALADGDFRLVVTGGARTAGAHAGRFGFVLGDDDAHVTELVRQVPAAAPGAVTAQMRFPPPRGETANVALVPRRLEHTITLGAFADRSDGAARTGGTGGTDLGVSDLAVVADVHRLAVVAPRLGREVVPVVPSMLATVWHAPNAARFLHEVSENGLPAWPRWRWGAADTLPYLPRVRRGRTVLTLARWRPTDPALQDRATAPDDWERRFDAWRSRWRVPDLVESVNGDNRIALDLRRPFHRALLRDEWLRRPGGVVQELPTSCGHGSGWLADGPSEPSGRVNEIAFPLIRADRQTGGLPSPGSQVRPMSMPKSMPMPTPTPTPTPMLMSMPVPEPRRVRTAHGPGSQWLYAKVYCSAERQDEILAQWLPRLLAGLPGAVDRWFYLRYRDPDAHLRLRFHGDPAELSGSLLPRLGAWSDRLAAEGLGGRLVLDTYEPELERYGGPAAATAAERAFQADSIACLAQAELLDKGELALDRTVLTALGHVDLACRVAGTPEGVRHLIDRPAHPGAAEPSRAAKDLARELIDPLGDWEQLRGLPGGPALLACWERRAPALSAYGRLLRELGAAGFGPLDALLHMHHNRLTGIDRPAEERSFALAAVALRSRLVRARAGR